MKLLFLCRFLPHPKVRDSGGQDVYHYIASLSERHSVSLIAFATPQQEDAIASMRSICEEVVTVPYHPHALLPRLWRAWWRLWMPRVYGRVVSLRYRRSLRALLTRTQIDLVIVDGMMAQYGNLIRRAKRVLDEIDVYSVIAYHIYRNEKRLLPRAWAMLDWLRQQVLELYYAATYDGILVRSKKDRDFLSNFIPEQNIVVLSPWFEGLDALREIPLRRPQGNKLLFMGAMNLPANVEAVSYFVHEILPLIRQQVPDVEFHIVGSAPVLNVQRLAAEEGVIVTGEVEDLAPYYERCAVNVVPLLRGGGIIVKTLNGMAAGRPTVATSIGNSGTGAQPGRDLLIVGNSPQSFASTVINLLLDQQLWQEIAVSGRRYIARNYRWTHTIQILEALLESLQFQR
jgi:glycosyltransferase involved in cell wall biosynthesis